MPISAAAAKMPVRRFVYLIAGENRVKVGVSYDVEDRLKHLQCASGVTLRLVDKWPHFDAIKVEREVHKRLQPYRQRGEWFAIEQESVRKIIEEVIDGIPRNPKSLSSGKTL